jgi:Cu-Zn family superoxide dismutase
MKKLVRLALAAAALAVAAPAMAQGAYPLPAEVTFPEGVAYDAKTQSIYTASSPKGTVARVDARTGKATAIASPEVAQQIGTTFPGVLGMKVDSRGRLWMAGGRTGKIFVVDPKTGRLIQTITTPEPEKGLINDIAFAGGRAYITDTFRPTLWAVDAGAQIPGAAEAFLSFDGTPLQYAQGANLNGITPTPDGRTLLTGQMNKGLLFKIDLASKQVSPIPLGAETVPGADGLILQGRTLYVIRQPAGEIVTVQLSGDLASGQVVKRTAAAGLAWPATGVIVGNELVVANSQFNKRGSNDPVTPFALSRVPLADLAGR